MPSSTGRHVPVPRTATPKAATTPLGNADLSSPHSRPIAGQATRFCIPSTLVPTTLLDSRRFTDGQLAVVCSRNPDTPGVGEVVWSSDPILNDLLFLPAKSSLPPFVEFTLRAIGWDEGMVRLVEVAWSSEGTRDAFILTLGEAGMPLGEGYLVWQLLSRDTAPRAEEL
jgi:hypothetical protein